LYGILLPLAPTCTISNLKSEILNNSGFDYEIKATVEPVSNRTLVSTPQIIVGPH
jgi:hypothetical protein